MNGSMKQPVHPPPKAHVLILAPKAPGQGLGGAERHLQDLANVLSPLCQKVTFLSHQEAPALGSFVRLLTRIEPMLASPLAVRRLSRRGLPEADVVMSIELMGVGLSHPRHLHLFFGSYAGFRSMALRPASGLRAWVQAAKSVLARWLERRTQSRFGSIANSQGLRDVLISQGIPVNETILLPPTDCNLFQPGDQLAARAKLGLPTSGRVILFAGRWEYAKGADRVARIAAQMPRDWHLLIATPPGYSWPLPRGSNVTTRIGLSTAQMVTAYQAADALIQPSRFEGYSLVASEAQACGCPVLTSPVGQAAHYLQAKEEDVCASVIANPDAAEAWISALERVFAAGPTTRPTHRQYAETHVSYEVVQRHWQAELARLFPEFSWHRS